MSVMPNLYHNIISHTVIYIPGLKASGIQQCSDCRDCSDYSDSVGPIIVMGSNGS